jgi:dihydrofolate synthase/folylpolyglutamate synthase
MDAYRTTLAELYALTARSLPDAGDLDGRLDRVRGVLAHLGSPERRCPAIHIGGTNGKGSTAAVVDAVLRRAGYRVGLFTSPHLIDFTERIRLDGEPISAGRVVESYRAIRTIMDRIGVPLAFFDVVTVMAFDAFARAGMEVIVLEVGLGGRFDATNVAAAVATAITSIGYDHQGDLGPTLAAIAREKAGIFKLQVPAIVGAVPPPAERSILACARTVGAPVTLCGRDYRVEDAGEPFDVVSGDRQWQGLRSGLRGRFQRTNIATAVMLLHSLRERFPVDDDTLLGGVRTVRWPGRCEVVCTRPLVIVDGAHNVAAMQALCEEIAPLLSGRRLRVVFGVTSDKDWQGMWSVMRPLVREVIVTQARGGRCVPAHEIADVLRLDCPLRIVPDAQEAAAQAIQASAADDAVLVTGSLLLVGDVYPSLPRDTGVHDGPEPWNPDAGDATAFRA